MPINTRARPRLRYDPKKRPVPKAKGIAVKMAERRVNLAGSHKRTQF